MNEKTYRTLCIFFLSMIVAYMATVVVIEYRKGNLQFDINRKKALPEKTIYAD